MADKSSESCATEFSIRFFSAIQPVCGVECLSSGALGAVNVECTTRCHDSILIRSGRVSVQNAPRGHRSCHFSRNHYRATETTIRYLSLFIFLPAFFVHVPDGGLMGFLF